MATGTLMTMSSRNFREVIYGRSRDYRDDAVPDIQSLKRRYSRSTYQRSVRCWTLQRSRKVPRTPEFMRGVINLRGNVVPVIDMRQKFGMTKTENTVNTCIIIVEIHLDGETTVLGALADAVQEVIELGAGQIEPAPKIGTRLKTDFIQGMGKRDEGFIIILDIDRVFSANELSLVHETEEG